MPGVPSANLVEPATPNSTSTHAPKPSWTASPRSRPILPPTATPALALYRNSAVSARPRSADSKSGSPRPPSNSISPSTATLSAKSTPTTWVLRPRKMRSEPALFLPRSSSGGNPGAQRGLPPAHPRGPIQPDPAGPASLHRKSPRPVGQRPLPRKRHGPDGAHRAPAGRDLL